MAVEVMAAAEDIEAVVDIMEEAVMVVDIMVMAGIMVVADVMEAVVMGIGTTMVERMAGMVGMAINGMALTIMVDGGGEPAGHF